jgi:subtilisin family serine protease
VVAPGERIVSARHDWNTRKRGPFDRDDLYVEMSGTSMASPHVSGLLASFLSLRKEFISYPDRLKAMLLASCVDLGRDCYIQGAGLPNLIKMLALN